MLIYSENITARLQYTAKVMFEYVVNLEYAITSDENEFNNYDGPKINYSVKNETKSINIRPNGLMESVDTSKVDIDHLVVAGMPVIFPETDPQTFPFDIFSAVFFMVSRYEEYNNRNSDAHGRFPLTEQISYKIGFHKKAIVHHWVDFLIKEIEKKNESSISVKRHIFNFTPSFDIDNAYAFLNKGVFRTIGGLIKNLNDIVFRLKVLSHSSEDPYDNYEYIDQLNQKFDRQAIYFLLCAHRGAFDRNINRLGKAFRELVKDLDEKGEMGIHPSYASNDDATKITRELSILEDLLQSEVKISRQHFLILEFPRTYRELVLRGIEKDYSMGFAEEAGFRAGMAVEYPFFDVLQNHETKLMIQPFQYMESSYMYYKSGSQKTAKEDLIEVIKETKRVGGHFIPIWHNESLGDWSYWKGWKEIFEMMYKECAND